MPPLNGAVDFVLLVFYIDFAPSGAGGCAVDDFNYGIHAYSFVSELMGPGIQSVRHLGKSVQRRLEIRWRNGPTGHAKNPCRYQRGARPLWACSPSR